MSHHLVSACMALKTGSPISKLVLLKLADNADVHGMCFPSYDYLAQYCELSIRTVKHHIKQLETLGFVERIKRFEATCINYAFPKTATLRCAAYAPRRRKLSHPQRGQKWHP